MPRYIKVGLHVSIKFVHLSRWTGWPALSVDQDEGIRRPAGVTEPAGAKPARDKAPGEDAGRDGARPGLQRFLARMYDDIYQDLIGDSRAGDA